MTASSGRPRALARRAAVAAAVGAVPADFLTRTMKWITPAAHPVIAIG